MVIQRLGVATIDKVIYMALEDDCYKQDITTNNLVPKNSLSEAYIVTKEPMVLAGIEIAKRVFKKLDKNVKFIQFYKDGDHLKNGARIIQINGKTRGILTGERTALNFLSHLSGVATNTNNFVKAIKPYKAKILSTRKTAPGLRKFEKYAVSCGGGVNHRQNLKEMIMIKDNHREICSGKMSLSDTILKLKKIYKRPLAVEVDTLNQFRQAIKAEPDIILLDNMSTTYMRQAVEINKKQPKCKRVLLEASGEITLSRVKGVAKTGVDRISIGALTHTSKRINMSLEIIW